MSEQTCIEKLLYKFADDPTVQQAWLSGRLNTVTYSYCPKHKTLWLEVCNWNFLLLSQSTESLQACLERYHWFHTVTENGMVFEDEGLKLPGYKYLSKNISVVDLLGGKDEDGQEIKGLLQQWTVSALAEPSSTTEWYEKTTKLRLYG